MIIIVPVALLQRALLTTLTGLTIDFILMRCEISGRNSCSCSLNS